MVRKGLPLVRLPPVMARRVDAVDPDVPYPYPLLVPTRTLTRGGLPLLPFQAVEGDLPLICFDFNKVALSETGVQLCSRTGRLQSGATVVNTRLPFA